LAAARGTRKSATARGNAKRGPGPRGGIPLNREKVLRVSDETRRGLATIVGDLTPQLGRDVPIWEAMGIAAFRYLRLPKAVRSVIVERMAQSPRERIRVGEEVILHVTPECYRDVLAVMGSVLPVFGRKVTAGEVCSLITRTFLAAREVEPLP